MGWFEDLDFYFMIFFLNAFSISTWLWDIDDPLVLVEVEWFTWVNLPKDFLGYLFLLKKRTKAGFAEEASEVLQ